MSDDAGALRAEVEELRAEVERLRSAQAAHVCAPPACTCGSATLPQRGPRVFYGDPVGGWFQNTMGAGGAAGGNTTYNVPIQNTAAANAPTFQFNPGTHGCAGGAAGQVFTFPAGA